MAERTMTEDRFDMVRLARPDAKVETRDGKEYVILYEYDFARDHVTEHKFLLIRDPNRIPVPDLPIRPVRTGPIANFSKWLYGQVYERPDGKTFKIVEPPKDEDK